MIVDDHDADKDTGILTEETASEFAELLELNAIVGGASLSFKVREKQAVPVEPS